jgi:hypothetical protein
MDLQLFSPHITLAYARTQHDLSSVVFNRRFLRQPRLKDLSRVLRNVFVGLRPELLHLHLET